MISRNRCAMSLSDSGPVFSRLTRVRISGFALWPIEHRRFVAGIRGLDFRHAQYARRAVVDQPLQLPIDGVDLRAYFTQLIDFAALLSAITSDSATAESVSPLDTDSDFTRHVPLNAPCTRPTHRPPLPERRCTGSHAFPQRCDALSESAYPPLRRL